MSLRAILVAVFLVYLPVTTANASVIGFEEFSFDPVDQLAFSRITDGYRGLDWGSQQVNNEWIVSPDSAVSWFGGPQAFAGNNFAWSNGGSPLALTRHGGGVFNLESLYAKTFRDFGSLGTVRGYVSGMQVATQTFSLAGAYTFISLNFSGIDEFRIDSTSPRPVNIIIDDVSVTFGAVPEPQNWLMLGFGFAFIGTAIRRRATSAKIFRAVRL